MNIKSKKDVEQLESGVQFKINEMAQNVDAFYLYNINKMQPALQANQINNRNPGTQRRRNREKKMPQVTIQTVVCKFGV